MGLKEYPWDGRTTSADEDLVEFAKLRFTEGADRLEVLNELRDNDVPQADSTIITVLAYKGYAPVVG